MSSLRAFAASMTGRIFLILLVGMALSAAIAWTLAEVKRDADLQRLDIERAADHAGELLARWQTAPAEGDRILFSGPWQGVLKASPAVRVLRPQPDLADLLRGRLPGLQVQAGQTDPHLCYIAAPASADIHRPCWLIEASKDGATVRMLLGGAPRFFGAPLVLDPLYLGVLAIAAAALALLVARLAVGPVRALAQAAVALGDDLARNPLPVSGPTELRQAAAAFNAMQGRLQRQLAERTHMLAAITHDLQTPITRLRLRLEKVRDDTLRECLLADLAAMRTLIREGLEFARTAAGAEDHIRIDLQSLVESLVEDAADAGQPVTLDGRCDAELPLMPGAMKRSLSNLIDNALKYGASAEVGIGRENGVPVVRIRDHGPGVPEEELEAVFEPFVRVETSRSRDTGGVGLGLTIARTLAERNGATVTLRNHPGGGAEAVIRFEGAAQGKAGGR